MFTKPAEFLRLIELEADQIRAWLAANKPNRYGKFLYSMGALGVAVEDVYAEFAPYMERFGITRESRR